MAEAAPFLGIIGFGLTICKDLYAYYHAYKGFDSSINSAFESIADVASTLVLLKDSCQDSRLDQERRDRVAACVYQCEDGLKKLSEKLQQLKISDPEGFREKSKARFKRHAFPFRKETLDGLRNSAVEVQRRLSFAIQVLDLTQQLKSQRVLDYLESWSHGLTVTIDQISDDTQRLLSFARSDEVEKIVQWLSPSDPWTNHHAARDLHQAGTGKWVLDHDAYKAWLCGASRHLWLYGKAGCGKTVLSSTIVEDVQQHCRQAVNFGFAPFYFTFSDQTKQSYEALLRSLVAQLGTQESGLPLLRERYDQRHEIQGGLSTQNLEPILLAILAVYDTVFVVLDALDECPEETNACSKLFAGLEYLSNEAANLKILMTSRDIPDIRDCMVRFPAERLPVMTSAVDDDIHSYVAQQLSQGQYFRRLKRESLDLIQTTITEKADGMFRWAYCQLFELGQSKSTRPSRVEHLLKTLPTTLDETYARMLERIGPAERGDALTLLRWLAYSMRPVTLAELQTAVIVRPEDDEVDIGDEGGLGDSLNILSGLVVFSECVIDSSTKEDGDPSQHGMTAEVDNLTPGTLIRLAHFSVKEYLESTRIFGSSVSFFGLKSGVCHRFLSQSCLTYLMHYSSVREEDRYRRKTESQLKREFAGPPSYRWHDKDQDIENFPLLDYTASQWYRHSQRQSGDDINREVALLTCEKAKSAWRWIYARHSSADRGSVPSVYDAVELNLPHVAEKLLKAGEDVNATGPGNVSLLVAATRNEDEAMVKLLIAHGADVNMFSTLTGYTSEIALFSAAFKELPLTQLLVDHGADVNLVCGHGTALSAASKCGNQPVVKFLLEKGALVDLVDGSRRTALIEASSNKCNEVVELLIAKGADVNSPNTHITPLIAAARSGNADGVAILINAGADINAQNSGALLDAILGGHAQTAALLETRGAKSLTSEQLNDSFVRVCDERISRGRPYHYDPERAVVLLLERGADVNSHDSSALLAALEQGHENMVALLEAKGAKQLTLEQLNGALFKVCSRRQRHYPETPVRLLLDRGADAHLVDRWARPSWVRHGAS